MPTYRHTTLELVTNGGRTKLRCFTYLLHTADIKHRFRLPCWFLIAHTCPHSIPPLLHSFYSLIPITSSYSGLSSELSLARTDGPGTRWQTFAPMVGRLNSCIARRDVRRPVSPANPMVSVYLLSVKHEPNSTSIYLILYTPVPPSTHHTHTAHTHPCSWWFIQQAGVVSTPSHPTYLPTGRHLALRISACHFVPSCLCLYMRVCRGLNCQARRPAHLWREPAIAPTVVLGRDISRHR